VNFGRTVEREEGSSIASGNTNLTPHTPTELLKLRGSGWQWRGLSVMRRVLTGIDWGGGGSLSCI